MVAEQNADLSASLEDYLEAIFNLAHESNIARSKDIAKLLGVSRASVTGALRVLKKKGLANYQPYDYVTLTEAGRIAAAEIAQKHKILKSFFINVLGVEPEVAQPAACRTEHALGPGIIGKLMYFIELSPRLRRCSRPRLASRRCQRSTSTCTSSDPVRSN